MPRQRNGSKQRACQPPKESDPLKGNARRFRTDLPSPPRFAKNWGPDGCVTSTEQSRISTDEDRQLPKSVCGTRHTAICRTGTVPSFPTDRDTEREKKKRPMGVTSRQCIGEYFCFQQTSNDGTNQSNTLPHHLRNSPEPVFHLSCHLLPLGRGEVRVFRLLARGVRRICSWPVLQLGVQSSYRSTQR